METELIRGRVTGSEGGIYTVRTEDGDTYECPARGVFRHEGLKVLVGDNVELRASLDGKSAGGLFIYSVEKRKNALLRPPMANLDMLFVVVAAAKPDPDTVNADKLIAIAEQNGIEPVVVVTKSDLDIKRAEELKDIYRSCKINAFVTRSDGDVSEVYEFIKNKASGLTSAFAGASGVGKSTLMTKLFPELSLRTGEISKKISRGRHTTRTVRLFCMSELLGGGERGYIADTPGFGLLDFTSFDFFSKEDLPYNFREFAPYLGKCRYTKCTHRTEEGCAVIDAVKCGEIPAPRHESYRIIYEDLKDKHKWQKKTSE